MAAPGDKSAAGGRVGTKILVRRSEFDAWLEAHPLGPAGTVDVDGIVEQITSEVLGKN